MYNRAIKIANAYLGEEVDTSSQVKQLRAKKEQLKTQFENKKKQLTDTFNQQIKTIDDQISKLGGVVLDTED